MSFPFQSQQGLIHVEVEVEGLAASVRVHLALDTGATDTAVSADALRNAGYNPAAASGQAQVTTASGLVTIPEVTVSRLTSLGQSRAAFTVLALTLPPSAGVDGVLGLDFLRGQILTIDFRSGQISLT
jgi:predicted aspartyl protease